MDLFLARPMMHAFGAKPRIVTVDVNPTPWYVQLRAHKAAYTAPDVVTLRS